MCKLVTVRVLPLWLSFSAQCNLSLSEWGILLLSFMIIVLIYLHNILMFQDVAAPVVVCVIFLCGCCWVIMGPECLVQWRFSTRQISQQTLKPQLLDPPGLYTILPHFRYFSFPSVYFCFVDPEEVRHWADCPNPLHVSIVTSWVWSLTQSKLGRAALTVSR